MVSRTILAAAAALIVSANAHMFIQSPTPIEGSAPKDPLDASGANFPCHGVSLSGVTNGTPMAVGSSQELSFALGGGANTAVHGGGSCQVSLTYETDPAKLVLPSSWKVIYSIMGGCPAFAAGNLDTAVECGAGKTTECVNSFNFTIPPEVKNGNAVLAWTWFNNIGNREIYMNCAAVDITGGKDQLDELPSMFVANLASVDTCPTEESIQVQFPNPGKYVTTMTMPAGESTTFKFAVPTGSGCVAAAAAASGSDSSPAAGTAASAPAAASSADSGAASTQAPETSAAAAAPTAAASGGGVFAPNASGAAITATSMVTVVQPTPAAAATSAAAAAPAPAASSGATGSGATGSGACADGAQPCTASGFYCISASTFGMCANGCAVPQQMAAGTDCVAGAVAAIALPGLTTPGKRDNVVRHRHVRMHRRGAVAPSWV